MSTRKRRMLRCGSRTILSMVGASVLLFSPYTATASQPSRNPKKVTIPIEGICSVGLADIRAGLKHVGGISKIEGSLTGEGIEVTYEGQTLTPDRIRKLIVELGYRTGAPASAR